MEIKELVSEILGSKKINKIYFAACGGSLAAMYPAKYFLEKESKTLSRIGFYTSNEFVHALPAALDENSLVIICSHQGTTPETVEAGRIAKGKGASVVAFTFAEGSPITGVADYVLSYSWGDQIVYSEKKEARLLKLCMELLYQMEGWQNYDAAMASFGRYDDVVAKAQQVSIAEARRFAEENKTEKVIYTVGGGACWGAAYMESICILMEMQWINSACIHAGEFFHGPLEITDWETPFLLFVGEGPTRVMDQRVLDFLAKYGRKVYAIDVKALGINVIDDAVVEYFAPLLQTAVVDVYNHELEYARKHPLSTRRYMWKVSY